MRKNKLKITTAWIVTILISIALIISSFTFDISKKQQNLIKIEKYHINPLELKNLTKKLLKNKKYAKRINKIEKKTNSLIVNNIKFNVKLKKYPLIATEKELLYTIFNLHKFQSNNKFSLNLYETYLKKKGITENEFLENVRNISLQNQIKKGINLIYKNNKKKKRKYIIKLKYKKIQIKNNINKKKIYNKTLINNHIENVQKIKYIDLSIKNIIKNKKITKHLLKKFKKKTKKNYFESHKAKIKHVLIKSGITKNASLEKEEEIWVTKNEINKILKTPLSKKNQNHELISIKTPIGTHLIKIIKIKNEKKYNNNKIKKDIFNKYRRQESKYYIKKNKLIFRNKIHKKKSLNSVAKYFNLKIKQTTLLTKKGIIYLKKIKSIISKKQTINTAIKIKKNRFIGIKIKKKGIENIPKKQINKYFNKIEYEKNIIKYFLKKKNFKTKKKTMEYIV